MDFVRWRPGDPTRPDRFGIPSPTRVVPVAVTALDLVVVPLVGADRTGRRLGRGRGYFDRALAHRRDPGSDRPVLVGVGYDFQLVELPPPAAHDVGLDAVLTPAGLWVTGSTAALDDAVLTALGAGEFPLERGDR